MGFLDRVASRLGYVRANELKKVAPFLLAHAQSQQFNVPDGSIYGNQASLYAKLSWIQTAIKHPGRAAATTPLNVRRRAGDKFEDIVNHPFETKLDQPNPLHSRFEFIEATYAWGLLTGNCYWWLNRDRPDQEPDELWILPSNMLTPIPDGQMFIKGYEFDPGNGKAAFLLPIWQIMHLRSFNPLSMFVGLSSIEPIATTAEGDLEQQKHSLKFFKKDGGRLPGVLSFKDGIANDEWKEIQKDFSAKAAKEQIMLLRNVGEKGIEWTAMEVSRKDMEFLASREFSRQEIYELFAPGLTAMLDSSANVASGRVGEDTLNKYAIYPFHHQLAAKITNDILPAYGDNLVAEFDDVRQPDRAMELEEQKTAWHVMTVDEVREKFWELPPFPDQSVGDTLAIEAAEGYRISGAPALPAPMQTMTSNDGSRDNSQQDGREDDNPIDAKARRVDVKPTQAQLMRDELERWQRFIMKRLKAGKSLDGLRPFETEYIPASLKGAIEGALCAVSDPDGVPTVFIDAMRWEGYP